MYKEDIKLNLKKFKFCFVILKMLLYQAFICIEFWL